MAIQRQGDPRSRAQNSKVVTPPRTSKLNKEPHPSEFVEGEIKVGKFLDNRRNKSLEHDALQIRVNGVIKSIPFLDIDWDNDTEELALQLTVNDKGITRTFRFIATEVI